MTLLIDRASPADQLQEGLRSLIDSRERDLELIDRCIQNAERCPDLKALLLELYRSDERWIRGLQRARREWLTTRQAQSSVGGIQR